MNLTDLDRDTEFAGITSDSDDLPNSGLRARFRQVWERARLKLLSVLFLLLFLVVYLAPSIFINIRSGEAGVQWKRFGQGTVTNLVFGEGLQIIPPWDTMTIYDVRIQQKEHNFVAISTNGLSIGVEVSIRYRPNVPLLGLLHKGVGPDYLHKIIVPSVQALIRDRFGQFTPEEIYTTKRSLIQGSLSSAVAEIGEEFLQVDNLLIKGITLPPALEEAIESKHVQEQRQLEMKYRIAKEESEVERKFVESVGISAYNQIIAGSLTDSSLTYKGIDATLDLAKSANAKIVMVGSKSGLPVILDTRLPEFGAVVTNQVVTNQTMVVVPAPPSTNVVANFPEKLMPRLNEATSKILQAATNTLNNGLGFLRRERN